MHSSRDHATCTHILWWWSLCLQCSTALSTMRVAHYGSNPMNWALQLQSAWTSGTGYRCAKVLSRWPCWLPWIWTWSTMQLHRLLANSRLTSIMFETKQVGFCIGWPPGATKPYRHWSNTEDETRGRCMSSTAKGSLQLFADWGCSSMKPRRHSSCKVQIDKAKCHMARASVIRLCHIAGSIRLRFDCCNILNMVQGGLRMATSGSVLRTHSHSEARSLNKVASQPVVKSTDTPVPWCRSSNNGTTRGGLKTSRRNLSLRELTLGSVGHGKSATCSTLVSLSLKKLSSSWISTIESWSTATVLPTSSGTWFGLPRATGGDGCIWPWGGTVAAWGTTCWDMAAKHTHRTASFIDGHKFQGIDLGVNGYGMKWCQEANNIVATHKWHILNTYLLVMLATHIPRCMRVQCNSKTCHWCIHSNIVQGNPSILSLNFEIWHVAETQTTWHANIIMMATLGDHRPTLHYDTTIVYAPHYNVWPMCSSTDIHIHNPSTYMCTARGDVPQLILHKWVHTVKDPSTQNIIPQHNVSHQRFLNDLGISCPRCSWYFTCVFFMHGVCTPVSHIWNMQKPQSM